MNIINVEPCCSEETSKKLMAIFHNIGKWYIAYCENHTMEEIDEASHLLNATEELLGDYAELKDKNWRKKRNK